MGIFSESPKSFKMDRKSPLASALKSSISEKLLQFLGNYTDDVLAEYIIVLVCNGKHQIQARDDLEAFLGERSGEFVSWLWDHLLKFAHQSSSAIGFDPKDVTFTSPSNNGADKDLRSNRLKDVQNHGNGNGNADSSLTKNGKYCHTSAHASSPDPSINVEHSEGIQDCKGLVEQSQKQRNTVPREASATENIHDDSLTHKPSRIGGSSLIATGREQSSECVDKSKKTVNHKSNGLPSQLSDFSREGMVFRNLHPSIIEDTQTRQIYDANVSARSPPRADGEISCQIKKSRGSVWDRLGKPRKDNCLVNDKAIDAHAVDIVEKDQEMYDQHTLLVPVRNEELCGSIKNEVHELDKSCSGNYLGESRKMEQGVSTICKLHAANDIRRKRHFGEISSGPSSCSVSLVGRSNMDHQFKESSQDFKRSNSTSEAAAPALVSQVQDVKQRLHQIEMEMSKLRTKQLEMKQPHELTNSGVLKHSEEDVESRTVFVTNVHFAATKEAISLYFAKCGVVLSVVILTDTLNAQPKGSAYITFANKESVDKAVALSGTSLFSRTLKVLRKAEEATVTSTTPQRAWKPSQAQFSRINRKTAFDRPVYPNSRLQWRREPASAPTEPSSAITQQKGVSSAASQQQLSSSLASVRTTKTATSSTGTPAAA